MRISLSVLRMSDACVSFRSAGSRGGQRLGSLSYTGAIQARLLLLLLLLLFVAVVVGLLAVAAVALVVDPEVKVAA